MRYVALLRGINVGGNTMIKMEALRSTFESLGLENVTSYINSGNLAFDSTRSGAKLAPMIESAIVGDFGKPVSVMLRHQKHIREVLANNPFEGEYGSHKEMHVLFLREEMSPEKQEQLRALAPEQERFGLAGREIYCHLPMGVADSIMGRGLFEKKLKVSVTARNWRTVQKLADL